MKTILVDAVYTFIIENSNGDFEISKEMFNLLKEYPNQKLVLTNASDDKFEQYKLNNLPYKFFTLKHNPEKTNPEYFKILLNAYGLRSEDVIYFEHNMDAVKSAESVGIKSYFYDENKKDLVDLKNFLDINLS